MSANGNELIQINESTALLAPSGRNDLACGVSFVGVALLALIGAMSGKSAGNPFWFEVGV